MAAETPPDVWALLFDQTPVALRWLLGGLIVGLSALAGWVWKLQHKEVKRVEYQLHSRMTREVGEISDRLTRENKEIREKLETMNGHLLNISQNTQQIVKQARDDGNDEDES